MQEEQMENILVDIQDKVHLAVVLLQSRNQDLYGSIKRAGDQALGFTTICHVVIPQEKSHPENGSEPSTNSGTLANISMKINMKAEKAAVNQAVDLIKKDKKDKSDPILTKRSMIIGIDVTH